MLQVSIRSERDSDVGAIDTVTREAFASQPFSNQTEHLIVQSLRSAGALTVSLVAEVGGAVIGHIAASPVVVAGEQRSWFGLGPVSVASAHQRQGIGSALVRAALAKLQAIGAAGCVPPASE
jgi:putative acetyltransferase